jgi:hypothetical protein
VATRQDAARSKRVLDSSESKENCSEECAVNSNTLSGISFFSIAMFQALREAVQRLILPIRLALPEMLDSTTELGVCLNAS